MNCQELHEKLTSHLLGDLEPDLADAIKRHLQDCPDCRAAAQELEATLNLLRTGLAAAPAAPTQLDAKHRQRLAFITLSTQGLAPRLLASRPKKDVIPWVRWAVPIAALIMIVSMAGLYLPVFHREQDTEDTMEMSYRVVPENVALDTVADSAVPDEGIDAGAGERSQAVSDRELEPQQEFSGVRMAVQTRSPKLSSNFRGARPAGKDRKDRTLTTPALEKPAHSSLKSVNGIGFGIGNYHSEYKPIRKEQTVGKEAALADKQREKIGQNLTKSKGAAFKRVGADGDGYEAYSYSKNMPASETQPESPSPQQPEPSSGDKALVIKLDEVNEQVLLSPTMTKSPLLINGLYGNRSRGKTQLVEGTAEDTKAVFRAYGVNPWVVANANRFSTFSMDVDTASYTLSRNYMLHGNLPPPEAVRTEEFVNFFDYAYPPPVQAVFGITTEYAPTPFSGEARLLKIGIKGRQFGRAQKQNAVLTFVIDTSGSMNKPDRLGLVVKSLEMLVERLDPADKVAVVHFNSQAHLLLNHTAVAEKERILTALKSLQTTGFTHLEDGLKVGYGVAMHAFQSGAANQVLLLSDGVANLGSDAAEDILKQVTEARKQGIYCSVFGFGHGGYDDAMLQTLADKGNGKYHFIDSPAEAKRIFVDELAATLHVIAGDAKIQVEFNPERVKQYRQLGYEKRQLKAEDFRDDSVDAGEVGSGQSVTALYEVQLQGDACAPLGTVRVRYRDVTTDKIEEVEKAIAGVHGIERFDKADLRFRLAAVVAEFAEMLRGSPYAERSDFEEVAKVLRPIALELNLDQKVQELLRLVQSAPSLSRSAEVTTD